jgi:CRISPR-associated protein Csm5
MNKPIKIKLHTISPVHIGCGDVYEPTSFVIRNNKLVVFDPMDFIKSLNAQDMKEFSRLCDKGNIYSIVEIMRFISEKQANIEGREVAIASGIEAHYQRVKDIGRNEAKNELNQFEISRTAYNPHSNQPYIPGSSLKGALRTGFLSILAFSGGKIAELKKCVADPKYTPPNPIVNRIDAKHLEEELLQGSFATDPLRMVKVSDLTPAGSVTAQIVYAVNKKKGKSEKETQGVHQLLEVLLAGATFEGLINIDKPEKKSGIAELIDADDIRWFLGAIRKHYVRVYREEPLIRQNMDIKPFISKDMLKKIQTPRAFLIRLGRHSGAEAITVEGNRHIKIIQEQERSPKYDSNASTIWLKSEESKPKDNENLIPFGWAVLELC